MHAPAAYTMMMNSSKQPYSRRAAMGLQRRRWKWLRGRGGTSGIQGVKLGEILAGHGPHLGVLRPPRSEPHLSEMELGRIAPRSGPTHLDMRI
jgi:hypothetical protein